MVKCKWEATESFRKRLRARSIAASGAALKQEYGFVKRQHVERDLIR